jgi:hypothetical protein
MAEVGGLPEMLSDATTVIAKAGKVALDCPSLTLI